MKNTYIKHIFAVVFILFCICNDLCYGSNVSERLSLNTAPVTLSQAELAEEDSKPSVEKAVPINSKISEKNIKLNSESKQINNFDSTISSQKNVKSTVYRTTKKQNSSKKMNPKKVQSLEILDFDATDNTLKNKDSESFLLVPIDKTQLEKESQQTQIEELTTSLIKDSPKQLTIKSKIKSKFSLYSLNSKEKNVLKKSKKAVLKSIIKILFIIIIIVLSIGTIGYFYLKKQKQIMTIKDKEEALSYEEEKRNELIQAIKEFEQTEEKHEKLGQKVYINELESYKNLDGFRKDEVSDDIIKTMQTIEQAQKNDVPLTLKENSTNGFKKNIYAFENELGTLSDEEGRALFDDVEETVFSTESEFLNPDYYNENTEIFEDEKTKGINNDIFIIEDDEEQEEDNYKIVEDNVKIEQKSDETTENHDNEEQNQENNENLQLTSEVPKSEKPKLQIKEKYPLDDKRGLALLSYKNTDALIGYINEKIVVLKRFSKTEKAENLSVRTYEELNESTAQYLVRTGSYKGIIEIGLDYIKSVLDL